MLVIDASAALYLLASAEGMEPLARLELAAPALLWSEVTSVLNEMRWRGELSESLAESAFERLLTAPIARRADAGLYSGAREVARELGWAKTYDAEYLALAQILGCKVLTVDGRMRRGADRLGIVIGPEQL